MIRALTLGVAAIALAACSNSQKIDVSQQMGSNPLLPKINEPILLPRTNIPPVIGWKAGEAPVVPAGFTVQKMASDLMSPRNVYALANGDVLVVQALKGERADRPT